MKKDMPTGMEFMEGRAYTIGREGHIRIDDPSLSRGHAEIKIADGRIRLRDLGSTNGTYLVIDNKIIGVDECFVSPNQRVVLGGRQYTIKALLARIGIYASYSNETGLVIKSPGAKKEALAEAADLDELVSRTISGLYDENTELLPR